MSVARTPATGRPGTWSEMLSAIRHAYVRHLRGRRTEAPLVATATYFATLVVVRLYTTLSHAGPGADIDIAGTHIHHVVFGILALLIAGVLGLDDVYRLGRWALFGVGAALVLDEFALLVFLKDVYWLPQGSLSIVAVLVGLVALAVNA
jgi:hypothetical protein